MESNQRSEEWFKQREGRATASEIHKLMGIKGLGETGKTYAFEKAIEELYGQIDENFESYDMQRGTELEPLAFEKFKSIQALAFVDVEKCGFFPLGKSAGASPDGLIEKDGVLEIKCPKAKAFFKMVAENEYDKNYFYQVQFQMLCTGRSFANLFFYLIHDGSEYHHTITINKNEACIKLMQERLDEFCQLKWDYVKKIQSNRQWISDIKVFDATTLLNEDF